MGFALRGFMLAYVAIIFGLTLFANFFKAYFSYRKVAINLILLLIIVLGCHYASVDMP